MKCLNLILFCSLFCSAAALAQSSAVRITPDCLFTGSLSAPGSTVVSLNGNGDNRSTGCSSWVVTWEIVGPSLNTVTIQSAVTTGGAPSGWGNFAGTVVSGANPSVAVTVGTVQLAGFVPWLRVTFAGGGSLSVRMFGWRDPVGGGSGGGAVTVSNFPNPQNVLVVNDCAGTVSQVAVSFAALVGAQTVVAAALGSRVTICGLQLAWDNSINFKLIQGSGVACGTGTGDLTGLFQNIVNLSTGSGVRTAISSGLCIFTSAAATGGGVLTYVQN
jgi:hypothetical protein